MTGTIPGARTNTTGAVTSNEGGSGSTATASLIVVAPPELSIQFDSGSVPLKGTVRFKFNVHNPNTATTLNNVSFGATLPPGLVVATKSPLDFNCAGSGSAPYEGGRVAFSLVVPTS